MVGFGEIAAFDPEQIREIFDVCSAHQQACNDLNGHVKKLSDLQTWEGDAATAAKNSAGKLRVDIDAHGQEVWKVAAAARDCYDEGVAVRNAARQVQADADAKGLVIDPVSGTVTDPNPPVMQGWADADKQSYHAEIEAVQLRVNNVIVDAERFDDDLAAAINAADGSLPLTPKGESENVNLAHRRANQVAAFRKTYGRDPLTTNDWRVAETLDPHNYDPKNQGVSSVIAVAKIRPVPGQGVVREGLFIPVDTVTLGPFASRNYGDNRGMDPQFAPENTRVTMVVDYENGYVIARQNPSVPINGDPPRVGVPRVSTDQLDDGTLRIRYNATDPFGPKIATDSSWAVRGDQVFTPTPHGIDVSGNVTDFPSMEIYQHSSDGATATLHTDGAGDHTYLGPLANLPFEHQFGDYDPAGAGFTDDIESPYYVPEAGSAAHIPGGGQVPVRTPDLPLPPLPGTPLGNPASPPVVASHG